MNRTRPWAALGLLAINLSISGCYVPKPVAHTILHIGADGSFDIGGQAVAADDLAARVAAVKPANGKLVVQIQAAPDAKVSSVRTAVAAVERAKARVAFTGDEPAP